MTHARATRIPPGLDGRLAVVTGAGSGLGRHFAAVLARAGAGVVLCGRRAQPLEDTRTMIQEAGGTTFVATMDVTREEDVRRAFNEIAAEAGVPDVLVNNAGVNKPTFATALAPADWDAVLDTNLKGCFLVAREFARRLIDAGKEGSVINVASILGLRAQKSVSAYMASKAGLLHLGRALALEWARYGIRVNALVPGYFRTEITDRFLDSGPGKKLLANVPQQRAGELAELDGPLLLLASDASRYMTGSTVVVDGGHLTSSL